MRANAPDDLVLGYTRTMMGFLAFNRQPKHLGIIGLGGGSIAKFCYRNLPHTAISVAEISPEVIALRDRFRIPKDDRRLEVFCMDGREFVERRRGLFDALLVDGFDGDGQPPELCSQAFYGACYSALTERGVLVVNACEGSLSRLVNRISSSFRNRIIVAGSDDSFNQILFAGKGRVFRSVTDALQRIEDLATSLRPREHSTPGLGGHVKCPGGAY